MPSPLETDKAGVGDRLCDWLAYHPRLTCALICGLCLSAGWLEKVLP